MVHPILAERQRLQLYLLAWVPVAALLAVLLASGGDLGWAESAAIAFPLALLYAFICLSAWYVSRGAPVTTTALARTLGAHAAAASISSALWTNVAIALARALEAALPGLAGLEGRLRVQWVLLFAVGVLLYLLASAVHYALLAADASRQAERRALEMQVYAREAELRALRAQIDPHFLFNSLHSISALTGSDPAGARRMALLLGDFLRDSLRVGGQERIPLGEELRLLRQFLDIEHVRFGDRLRVEWRVAEDTHRCELPPLLLQPLVENAVRHGIAHLVEGGEIRISAERRGGRLHLAVENPCDPDRPQRRGAGVGLDNVRRRLETAFGAAASARASERDGGFTVDLVMPCSSS
ncbi:MAG TPA: histidine kinase [Vicinamibacterales bacterium]|nr:histidine kinase [Vicinamibacterales bacterium]